MRSETSRRALLQGLTAAPMALAATALPIAATGAPTAAEAHSDAALIALAAHVVDLARRELAALQRVDELKERLDDLCPKKPSDRADEAAWQAECDRIAEELGHTSALSLRLQLFAQLEADAYQLALTPPWTMAGLTAKALAWMEIMRSGFDGCAEEHWLDTLGSMIIRETVMLGHPARSSAETA